MFLLLQVCIGLGKSQIHRLALCSSRNQWAPMNSWMMDNLSILIGIQSITKENLYEKM